MLNLALVPASQAATQITLNDSFTSTELSPTPLTTSLRAGYRQVLSGNAPAPGAGPARHWYRINLQNTGFDRQQVYLQNPRLIAQPTLIYKVDERGRMVDVISYNHNDYDLPSRLHSGFTVPLTLAPTSAVTLLIGVAGDKPAFFPLVLDSRQRYEQKTQQHLLLLGIVGGALMMLMAYFFLSYLYQKTPARFWLAASAAVVLILLACSLEPVARQLQFMHYGHIILPILLAILLFCLAKFGHSLFRRIPLVLRLVNLALAAVPVALLFVGEQQGLWLLQVVPGYALLQTLLAIGFRDRRNMALHRLLALGWLLLSLSYVLALGSYNPQLVALLSSNITAAAALLLAYCTLALCVLLTERDQSRQQIHTHERTISSLNVFYDLFRNSAEGLYTSTLDGELRSINPAMCTVFGYPDEDTMLAQVPNTKGLYADPNDRDLLVGELLEKKAVMGREFQGRRADGSEFWFASSCQLHTEHGQTFLSGSVIDITKRKLSDHSLNFMASHDPLTGAANRQELETHLTEAMADQETSYPVLLLHLNLDHFKVINDSCGHKAGDRLLKELAVLLSQKIGERGLLARLGADSFGLLLTQDTVASAQRLAHKLLEAVEAYRFVWQQRVFELSMSIGLLNASAHQHNADTLLDMAAAACHVAKQQGRGQVAEYVADNPQLKAYEQERQWVQRLNEALAEDGFTLYYQHFMPLSKTIEGDCYEVLLRLRLPDGRLASPAEFMPTAQRYNLTARIDRWVAEATFAWLKRNPERLSCLHSCNLNLHSQSVADADLRRFLLNAFHQHSIPHAKICFEITENTAMAHHDTSVAFIDALTESGCRFAIDDFGSGFSSYNFVKSLPVHSLKIDASVTRNMLHDPVDMAIVTSIREIALARQIQTIAECVEDKATMAQLGKMGIDFAQGNAIAAPAPLEEFKALGGMSH